MSPSTYLLDNKWFIALDEVSSVVIRTLRFYHPHSNKPFGIQLLSRI